MPWTKLIPGVLLAVCEENIGELLGFAQLVPGENMVDEKHLWQKVQKLKWVYDNKSTGYKKKSPVRAEYDLVKSLKNRSFPKLSDTEFENLGKRGKNLKEHTSIEAHEYIKILLM